MKQTVLLPIALSIVLAILSCGKKDKPETESNQTTSQDSTYASSGQQRYAELRVTVQDIIKLIKAEDDRGIYQKYVKPSELERIDRQYGGLDSALTNFKLYRSPLLYVLDESVDMEPVLNADTTEAVFKIESAPGPVNFVYMNDQWYFNP